WVREQLSALEDQTFIEPTHQSLEQFLQEWLEAVRPTMRPSAWASFESHSRVYLIPRLGHIKVQLLSATDIDRMTARLLAGEGRDGRRPLSPTTVRRIIATLNAALGYGVRKRRLERNVASLADRPRAARVEMHVWDATEV